MTSSIYTCMTSFIYTYMISSIYMTSSIDIWRHCKDLVIFWGLTKFFMGVPNKFFLGAHQFFSWGAYQKIFTKSTCHVTHGNVIALRARPRFWGFIFAFERSRVLTHAFHCARLQHATLARVAMATRYTALLSEIPPNTLHHTWLTLSIASRLQYRCIDFFGQNRYLHLILATINLRRDLELIMNFQFWPNIFASAY